MNAVTIDDYCCCAGLGADGYASVFGAAALHGYDHEPQPDYPYAFTQADVRELMHEGLRPATARHFSFPCQFHTDSRHLRKAQGGESKYEDMLTPGLAMIREYYNDTPWICENIDDRTGLVREIMAPRQGESLIVLCGSMFGLAVQRHRLFLANFPLRTPQPIPHPQGKKPGKYRDQGCDHSLFPVGPKGKPKPVGVYHVKGDKIPEGGATAVDDEHGRKVMGSHRSLPWDKLKEGFPPAYTAWVAADLLAEIARRENAVDTIKSDPSAECVASSKARETCVGLSVNMPEIVCPCRPAAYDRAWADGYNAAVVQSLALRLAPAQAEEVTA